MNHNPPAAESDELHWLAFRYVQNELSDAEYAEFEIRLSKDAAACDAVVQAMRLSAGLDVNGQSAAPMPAPAVSRPSSRRLLPVGVSAALVLLTGLVFTFWPSPSPTETDLASLELVNRWRLDSPFAGGELLDLDELNDDDAEILDESLSAPSWMMSAVKLSDELGTRP